MFDFIASTIIRAAPFYVLPSVSSKSKLYGCCGCAYQKMPSLEVAPTPAGVTMLHALIREAIRPKKTNRMVIDSWTTRPVDDIFGNHTQTEWFQRFS